MDIGLADVILPERTHLVLIPSYNTGPKLVETVRAARRHWTPVWVVIDGSTDDSDAALDCLAATDENIRVFVLPRNAGKGAAILHGIKAAEREGFSHVLTMDADGQHPADLIPGFMAMSAANPKSLILGDPVFDHTAPLVRVLGRKLSNWWTDVETLWVGRFDSLFGFRVYPVADLREVMDRHRWMRRFDFDAEAAVRLVWRGYRPISVAAPVRYFRPHEGGVSHFHYVRDNVLLGWMHLRLVAALFRNLPRLLMRRIRSFRH
jgi:glycosyltransferase involved in cell wall biosynthesis